MKKPAQETIRSSVAGKRKLGLTAERARVGSRSGQTKYVLRLYVSGSTSKSARAVENVTRVCEQHLQNRYDLEVIDVYQQAHLAGNDQIAAVPTLVIRRPLPSRRVIGDLGNQQNVLWGLGLK